MLGQGSRKTFTLPKSQMVWRLDMPIEVAQDSQVEMKSADLRNNEMFSKLYISSAKFSNHLKPSNELVSVSRTR